MSLNRQGPGKIDWTDYTFNPVSGCLHNCNYCYLLRMEKRFPGIMAPKFRPHYLIYPHKLKKPSKIFVGSSGDMWGAWVERRWINAVLAVCESYPQHTFQFLTKNPLRYAEFENLPVKNTWYGTSVDGTERTEYNIDSLVWATSHRCYFNRFISFEPLLAPVDPDLFGISWIIIGANSNPGAEKPPKEWADHLIGLARKNGIAVFVKDNYGYPERIKEFPKEVNSG